MNTRGEIVTFEKFFAIIAMFHLPVDTMAIKSMIKMSADPACPSRWSATAGGTNPEPASPELIGSMRAVEASPSEVAKEKGIANLECRRANSELRSTIFEQK